jgi:GNAT superfamily N-acetyltransferase
LANVGWVGLTRRAKECFDRIPYSVDFEHGEAFTGGVFTIPGYRGKGLMFHCLGERLKYLQERGYRVNRDASLTGNVASLRVTERFAGKPRARGFYVRVFRWSYWREKPLERDCLRPSESGP